MPKFSQHNPKNDSVVNVQFHNTNLALKMPKWETKTLKLATCCSLFVAKKVAFEMSKHFLMFLCRKNSGINTFMKLISGPCLFSFYCLTSKYVLMQFSNRASYQNVINILCLHYFVSL